MPGVFMFRSFLGLFSNSNSSKSQTPVPVPERGIKPYSKEYYQLEEQLKKPALCYAIVCVGTSPANLWESYDLGQLIYGHHDQKFMDITKFYEHLFLSKRGKNKYFFEGLEEAYQDGSHNRCMLPSGCLVIGFHGTAEDVLTSCKAGKLSSMICGAWRTKSILHSPIDFRYVYEKAPVDKLPCMMRAHLYEVEEKKQYGMISDERSINAPSLTLDPPSSTTSSFSTYSVSRSG
jgi:hypothetical protein